MILIYRINLSFRVGEMIVINEMLNKYIMTLTFILNLIKKNN
jgi:hypothetical protein